MAKITVYEFDYYDAEQGTRFKGRGMHTSEKIKEMRGKNPVKDHQIIESSGIKIDGTDLNETDTYYPEVEVTNPTPDSKTDITEFLFKHSCCTNAVMSYGRDKLTEDVTFTCPGCGFHFSFPQLGGDAELIARVAIDGVARDLPSQPVRIVPGN